MEVERKDLYYKCENVILGFRRSWSVDLGALFKGQRREGKAIGVASRSNPSCRGLAFLQAVFNGA